MFDIKSLIKVAAKKLISFLKSEPEQKFVLSESEANEFLKKNEIPIELRIITGKVIEIKVVPNAD